MARPLRVFTREEISKVKRWAANGHSVKAICKKLGCGETKFYVTKRVDNELKAAHEEGMFDVQNAIYSEVYRIAMSEEISAVKLRALEVLINSILGREAAKNINITTKDVTPDRPPTIINHFIEDKSSDESK